jgi:hypothetical protein
MEPQAQLPISFTGVTEPPFGRQMLPLFFPVTKGEVNASSKT